MFDVKPIKDLRILFFVLQSKKTQEATMSIYMDSNFGGWERVKQEVLQDIHYWGFELEKWTPQQEVIDMYDEIRQYASATYPEIFMDINVPIVRQFKLSLDLHPFTDERLSSLVPPWASEYKYYTRGELDDIDFAGYNTAPSEFEIRWRLNLSYYGTNKKEIQKQKTRIDALALDYKLKEAVAKFGIDKRDFFGRSHTDMFGVIEHPKGGFEIYMATPTAGNQYLVTECIKPLQMFFESQGKKRRMYVNKPSRYSIFCDNKEKAQKIIQNLSNYLYLF